MAIEVFFCRSYTHWMNTHHVILQIMILIDNIGDCEKNVKVSHSTVNLLNRIWWKMPKKEKNGRSKKPKAAKNASTLLNFCRMLAAARRSTFPWKWTRIGKSEDHTDDQPFNMFIFRIVFFHFFPRSHSLYMSFCWLYFIFRSVGVVAMLPKTVYPIRLSQPFLVRVAEQPKTDINVGVSKVSKRTDKW